MELKNMKDVQTSFFSTKGENMDRFFYKCRNKTGSLEGTLEHVETFEEFEKMFSEDFLNDDNEVGYYLQMLLMKYKCDAATISQAAGLHRSYVGNIVNGKKNNPSRDSVLAICLAMHTRVDEVQSMLKFSGHAPLYIRRK